MSRTSPRLWLAGGAVLVSLAAAHSSRAQRYDRRIGIALSRPLGRTADQIFSVGTELGSFYAVLGAAGVLRAAGRRRLAARVASAGALAWFAAQGAKRGIDRSRPYEADGAVRLVSMPSGTSWPSGHTAVAAAVASALADVLSRPGRALASALVGFVAHSRIYVGVHYLSDVVAGLGLGVLADRIVAGLKRLAE